MSKCGRSSVGLDRRWNAQRVSISGTSNVRPLNVTSSVASSKTRPSSASSAVSPAGPLRKNWRMRKASPSNHAQPTRNAIVPAPPLNPVVSMSKNTTRLAQSSGSVRRRSNSAIGASVDRCARYDADLTAAVPLVGLPDAIDGDARASLVLDDRAAEGAGRSAGVKLDTAEGLGNVRQLADRPAFAPKALRRGRPIC